MDHRLLRGYKTPLTVHALPQTPEHNEKQPEVTSIPKAPSFKGHHFHPAAALQCCHLHTVGAGHRPVSEGPGWSLHSRFSKDALTQCVQSPGRLFLVFLGVLLKYHMPREISCLPSTLATLAPSCLFPSELPPSVIISSCVYFIFCGLCSLSGEQALWEKEQCLPNSPLYLLEHEKEDGDNNIWDNFEKKKRRGKGSPPASFVDGSAFLFVPSYYSYNWHFLYLIGPKCWGNHQKTHSSGFLSVNQSQVGTSIPGSALHPVLLNQVSTEIKSQEWQ